MTYNTWYKLVNSWNCLKVHENNDSRMSLNCNDFLEVSTNTKEFMKFYLVSPKLLE